MSENMSVNELTAIEAARRLGIDLNRVYLLLRLGRLDGHKQDGEWRVSRDAVEERLRTRERRQALAG
jgi:excisionase family DNA binding protein